MGHSHSPDHAQATSPASGPATGAATLLVLMLHQAYGGPAGNTPQKLDALFAHLAAHHHCVLPGEPLLADRLNFCLSFDDGYLDFLQFVLPSLGRHNLRALLAIPTALPFETCDIPESRRLEMPSVSPAPHTIREGLCTWDELRTVAASGRVAFAAHGMTHIRLDAPAADLAKEIVESGNTLAGRLGVPVDSFVFPHGRFSRSALALVRRHYRHAFRIGDASLRGWSSPVLYRVSADGFANPEELFAPQRLRRYARRAWWNRLRGR